MAETRTWTIPSGAPLTFDATKYILTASSSRGLDDNVYQVSLSESATYGGNTFSNTVTFSVTVTDPCLTTVITPFSLNSFSLENGKTHTQDFTRPTDSAADAVSKPNICGTRYYTVKETIGGIDVAQTIVTISTVTADTTYRLTTNTMLESQVGVHSFKLIVTLENLGKVAYPKLEVPFTVTITPAICDCTMLTWDVPNA